MEITFKHFCLSIILCCLFVSCDKEEVEPVIPDSIFSISSQSIKLPFRNIFGYPITAILDNKTLDTDAVIWSSENSKIVTIDSLGFIFTKSVGETNIVATLVSDGRTAKCKVIVVDKNKYKFRLTLKDKGVSQYSVDRPKEFLSDKAIERRLKYNIPINEQDIPISPDYMKEIEGVGGKIVVQSKWLKTVTVYCEDGNLINKYLELPFIERIDSVWIKYPDNFEPEVEKNVKSQLDITIPDIYGNAKENIAINNGYPLHEAGFKGQEIDIAVIDAGFINFESNATLSNVKVKGAKSFIYEDRRPYVWSLHGIRVLSTMATNMPGSYIGTAPEANYWLLRTEDESAEYPAEEDYLVTALEFADSVGVKLVNISLGYAGFDFLKYKSYTPQDMDGKTAYSTRATNIASEKGILIVCGSGNSNNRLGTPAESSNVLTVGSVGSDRIFASDNTAWGITQDGRMKPDIVSLGAKVAVIDFDGTQTVGSGSSYASPIVCGLVACLWQAYPQLTNKEILDIIKKSADRYNSPELPYGWGIPDMKKAMEIANSYKK